MEDVLDDISSGENDALPLLVDLAAMGVTKGPVGVPYSFQVEYRGMPTPQPYTGAENLTASNSSVISFRSNFRCVMDTPTSQEMLAQIGYPGIILLTLATCFTVATFGVFIDEFFFLVKHYKNIIRRRKTMSILGIYPIYSLTSLLALWVPRSSLLIELVATTYFSTVVSNFMILLGDYYGGGKNHMIAHLKGQKMNLRTGPVCCCLCCLPQIKFNEYRYKVFRILVMQTAIIKPFIMLIAAVLWADGVYQEGVMQYDSPALYIFVINIISTFLAVYGLVQFLALCKEHLKEFHITAKFYVFQCVLIFTSTIGLIAGLLVGYQVLPCVAPFSGKDRGTRLTHTIIVGIMLPLSLAARKVYLRPVEYQMDQRSTIYKPPITDAKSPREITTLNGGRDLEPMFSQDEIPRIYPAFDMDKIKYIDDDSSVV